ncbi:SRPBCC family protein [Gordonia sp. CPCC 205515]|uniref:type II toxin-antitoxin system Rv0910 family toxin n=1 Tax=Gordonia sp. CPCC 205515 TaxID=3140791 RepID=UPI003AF38DC1
MAKTSASVSVDLSPDDVFAAVSDLSRFDEWLILHGGWGDEVPVSDELVAGTRASSVVSAKGTPIGFDWVIDTFDRPRRIRFSGKAKGGVKAKIDLTIESVRDGSTLTFVLDLGGLPLIGPAGKLAVKTLHPDVEESLKQFAEVFG